MPLPECFCWTRFGTEAGQRLEEILARKEQERKANNGVFFWGIGNAIGPSMLELLRRTRSPEAVFSPIQSVPRREDATPESVVAWSEAQTLSGEKYRLPQRSLITSRIDPLRPKLKHYALVCCRKIPIAIGAPYEHLQFSGLRNLLTNRPVGASQVTAVVHMTPSSSEEKSRSYNVAFRAFLTPPYFIELTTPVPLSDLEERRCWSDVVHRAWNAKRELSFFS